MKLLLDDGRVDPGFHPTEEDLQIYQEAIDHGEDLDHPYSITNMPIRMASKYGHLEIVRLLLDDKRVDPTDRDNDAIWSAYENGHVDVVKLLLKDERVTRELGSRDIRRLKKSYKMIIY